MTVVRAQVIFETFSGMPEHEVTNTLYFNTTTAVNEARVDDIVTILSTFYNSFEGMYSPVLTGMARVKCYDMTTVPTGPPLFPGKFFNIDIAIGNNGMPEECAIVLSFNGAAPKTARRRGRIYLGPTAASSYTLGANDAWCRHGTVAIENIQNAAEYMMINANTMGCDWIVYSTKYGTHTPVVGGWVDDSPDTQRRRGHDTEVRSTFGV